MGKRRIVNVLAVGCMLVCCAFGAACAEGKEQAQSLKLVDFNNSSETVELGKCYEVSKAQAKDADGKLYDVTVQVYKLKDGKKVSLISGMFDVLDVGGYKIVYTATDGSKTAKRTVTLTVQDNNAPVISINGSALAEVGKKYVYPTIVVSDDSGNIVEQNVKVVDGANHQEVTSDAEGFTPTAIGAYRLEVSAKDAAGNEAKRTFDLYARRTLTAGEIDGFGDEGVEQIVYTKEGREKNYALLSAFTKSADGFGSAMVASTSATETGVYYTPTADYAAFEAATEDSYLSLWYYIASPTEERKKVYFGNAETEVDVNVWNELQISKAEVGDFVRFASDLKAGKDTLFSVQNGAKEYAVFLDDLKLVTAADQTLDGLKEQYANGEAVSFTAAEGVSVTCWHNGKAQAVSSGFVPAEEGAYQLFAAKDGKAVKEYAFTVGNKTLSIGSSKWFKIGEANELPELKAEENGVDAPLTDVKYYFYDLRSGEKTLLSSALVPEEKLFMVVAEGKIGTSTVSAIRLLNASKYAQNTWYDFNDAESAVGGGKGSGGESFTWHEEYEGETGVLEIKLKADQKETFAHNRDWWRAVFTKEHYEQYDMLVFRIRTNAKFWQFSYIAELSPWKQVTVLKGEDTISDWVDCYVSMDLILENFAAFNDKALFYLLGEEGSSFYISEMYCETAPVPKENAWLSFDSGDCAAVSRGAWHKSFDGETGVTEFKLECAEDGSGVERSYMNRSAWLLPYDKEYYKKYYEAGAKLVIKAKATKSDQNMRVFMTYVGERNWKNTTQFELTTEWAEYEIDFKFVYENFESFAETGLFMTNAWIPTAHRDQMTGRTASIYIADMSLKLPDEDEPVLSNGEVGAAWKDSWC